MKSTLDEREYLDRQEALAHEGLERAVRGLGVDLLDALSLPTRFREHEMFETGVAAAAAALGNEATLRMIEGAVLGKSPTSGGLPEALSRAGLESLLALTATDRAGTTGR